MQGDLQLGKEIGKNYLNTIDFNQLPYTQINSVRAHALPAFQRITPLTKNNYSLDLRAYKNKCGNT